MPQHRLLNAALAWAARGVPVLPVRAGEKTPLTRHGLHDASTDPATIWRWWTRWPDANVAIATGTPGVDVLDVDVRGQQSGWPAVRRLRQEGLLTMGAPVVKTPSGGIHLYFIGSDQRSGSLPTEHLDFRAAGGYVLVPPSQITTEAYAGAYQWERGGTLSTTLDWRTIDAIFRPPPSQPAKTASSRPAAASWDAQTLADAVERQQEGNRNRFLFWAFCEALRSGYDLRPIADAGLRCGQTVREVQATWRSAHRQIDAADRAPSHANPVPSSAVRRCVDRPPQSNSNLAVGTGT